MSHSIDSNQGKGESYWKKGEVKISYAEEMMLICAGLDDGDSDLMWRSIGITGDMSFGTRLKQLALLHCSGVEHLGSHFKNCNNLTGLIIVDSEEIDWHLFQCTPKMQLKTLELEFGRETDVMKKVINLDKLFGNMPRINNLYLDGFFLESLERNASVLKRPITTLEKLNLEGVRLQNLVHIHNALCLIRSSPNLRYLRLVLAPEVYSSNNMDSLDASMLSVDMIPHQLKTVEIQEMIGSVTELQLSFNMPTNKERIENIEATLGGLQDQFSRLKLGMADKFNHLENAISQMTESLLSKQDSTINHNSKDQGNSSRGYFLNSRDGARDDSEGGR
ncbi:hypothetical protein AgCh_025772 [Apium graveolens]